MKTPNQPIQQNHQPDPLQNHRFPPFALPKIPDYCEAEDPILPYTRIKRVLDAALQSNFSPVSLWTLLNIIHTEIDWIEAHRSVEENRFYDPANQTPERQLRFADDPTNQLYFFTHGCEKPKPQP